jgi:hypothetical protein
MDNGNMLIYAIDIMIYKLQWFGGWEGRDAIKIGQKIPCLQLRPI